MKLPNTIKTLFICASLTVSGYSFAQNDNQRPNPKGPNIDVQTVQKFNAIKNYAENRGAEVTLDSIELTNKNVSDGYTTMMPKDGGSCTVTVTVNIAGQEAQVSATAATCSGAMNMVKEGIASLTE
ncbi:hypothetical protein [Idiomarina sp. ST10R2A5]|uniref:hypothetical protein n=1 Tax=Idiomarina sp. ST10R2A5 TaxID=3418368 RepID=UPI003EC8AC86